MSYRDPKQSLEGPISKILEGIEEFISAVEERHKSDEWDDVHLNQIKMAAEQLFGMRYTLMWIKRRLGE